MLTGIKLYAHPTEQQKLVLSQWMGCAKTIWNAKCEEERYHTQFARKYYPIGTYAVIDQVYSRYKNKQLTPWLYEVPSQILRNSAVNWYNTYRKFIKGVCGKPKRKHRDGNGSIHLTRELFEFRVDNDGVERLFIGTQKFNLGVLSIKNHTHYEKPKSLYIKKQQGRYTVSFCYEDAQDKSDLKENVAHLDHLKGVTSDYLDQHVIGVDRGVIRPVQASSNVYDFSAAQKNTLEKKNRCIKRQQKKLARQDKGSKRREKTKQHIAQAHRKIGNIRNDFCHKTSHALVNHQQNKIIVFEDLRTKSLTQKPKPKLNIETGRYEKNRASQKAGLNKAILNVGWHKLEAYTKYKACRAGKAFFKVSAYRTSQECALCDYTHPDNRKRQDLFVCGSCGQTDNADHNASLVIKKRAIKLIQDSGTELSKRGVLISFDTGRGAKGKTRSVKMHRAHGNESSKKKEQQLLNAGA